jgi:cell division protein FtsI/penicillin-binding protein 2
MRHLKQQSKKPKYLKILVLLLAIGSCMAVLLPGSPALDDLSHQQFQNNLEARGLIASKIGTAVKENHFPSHTTLKWKDQEVTAEIKYTLDPLLQKEAEKLLKSYKPDYAAILLMEADTGKVLVMTSFQRDDPLARNWNLAATFPAASVFKVVTATAAVDGAGVSPYDKIKYNGGAYTLYRKNVLSDKVTRWTNVVTLKDAFARSLNTAFGRLSIENIEPQELSKYADRYMFNNLIPADFPVEVGVASVPDDKGFALAEVASGYNRISRMSPVQGAMIAASVSNNGEMVVPYIVDEISNQNGEVIYQGAKLSQGIVMTPESAQQMRVLMEQTVLSGTSRRSFASLVRDRKFSDVEMGGKTGHLTGDNPKGRTDWFVGYAHDGEKKIAVAAITVNKEFWTVKSAQLGKYMFRSFFKNHYAREEKKNQASLSSARE